jgi:hypothetical protein
MLRTIHNSDGSTSIYFGRSHLCDCESSFDALLIEALLAGVKDINAARKIVRDMTVSI